MYQVKIIKKAQKDLDKIVGKTFEKIKNIILNLSTDPIPQNSIKLTNREEYRIRLGTIRILYDIDKKNKIIQIIRIKHRKDIYKF
jgi:mRNA interferase RelE/StbE